MIGLGSDKNSDWLFLYQQHHRYCLLGNELSPSTMCAFIFLALDIVQESSVGDGKQEAQMADDRLWTMLLWMYYLVVLVGVLLSIIAQRLWTWSGPCGIPGYPGIPGFFQNPDPGILKNLIPGFFGISRSP